MLQFSIGPFGSAILGLVTLPTITWYFTVEDIGRFTMMQVVLGLGVSFFSIAMHQAYVREYHEEEDKGALLKASIAPGVILLSVVFFVFLFFPNYISSLIFDLDSFQIGLLIFFGLFAAFLINFLTHNLRMEERGLAFSVAQILPRLILLILIVVMLFFDLKDSFLNLVLANSVALALSLFLLAWLTKKSCILAIKSDLNVLLMKNMLLFSLPLVAGGLAYWGLTTVDRFFLKTISGFEELGVYAVASTLAGAANVLAMIFSNIWHPVVYKWIKKDVDVEKIQQVVELMTVAVAIVWTVVGLFSWMLLHFLPVEYAAVEYLVVACIAGPLFYMLSETTVIGIGITRKTSYSMFASVAAFIVCVILNYFLVPKFGASGSALSSLFAFFVFFIMRTEFSVYLWRPLLRMKIYVIMSSYILTTFWMVTNQASSDHFYLIWFFLLSITFLSFKLRMKKAYSYFLRHA